MKLVFDIETSPLSEKEIAAIVPPFNPEAVKVGNLKDPDKIRAKIEEERASYMSDIMDKAALDALTGRVLCIGIYSPDIDETTCLFTDQGQSEAWVLKTFWDMCWYKGAPVDLIGFNSHLFDLPFLFRRSWKHGIKPPNLRRGRYWSDSCIDLRDLWAMGDWRVDGSLDSIAKHLGIGAKNGEGKNFYKLWETDRKAAMEYLENDLRLTAKIAEVLGVIKPMPAVEVDETEEAMKADLIPA